MISFRETWLPQILGYCELVCDDLKIRRAWINHDTSATSVTSFDELYEQIFGDLDSDRLQAELPVLLNDADVMQHAIHDFLEALRASDRVRATEPGLKNASAFLSSKHWKLVQTAARATLAAEKVTGGEFRK